MTRYTGIEKYTIPQFGDALIVRESGESGTEFKVRARVDGEMDWEEIGSSLENADEARGYLKGYVSRCFEGTLKMDALERHGWECFCIRRAEIRDAIGAGR